jgi:hypothetical protein
MEDVLQVARDEISLSPERFPVPHFNHCATLVYLPPFSEGTRSDTELSSNCSNCGASLKTNCRELAALQPKALSWEKFCPL